MCTLRLVRKKRSLVAALSNAHADVVVFRVTFFYEEPLYAARRGIEPRTYKGSFIVAAHSKDAAIAKARAQFDEAARESSVSWPREIVRTDCRAA